MQRSEDRGKYWLEKASKNIIDNHDKAVRHFNFSTTYLKESTDRKVLDLAYDCFYKLLKKSPCFSGEIEKSFIQLMSVTADPYFAEKQQLAAYKIAMWYFKTSKLPGNNPSNLTNALYYISQAARFHDVSSKIFALASRIFQEASVNLSVFQNRLENAIGNENKEELLRLKENLAARFEHIPTEERDAFIRLFLNQMIDLSVKVIRNIGHEKFESTGLKDLASSIEYRPSRKVLPKGSSEYIIERYKNLLTEFRQYFKERFILFKDSNGDIRAFQKEVSTKFIECIRYFLRDAFAILGDPPCGYDLRAMGSLAREEICPFSDLEWCILIQNIEEMPYFINLANLLELQIICLGETPPSNLPVFTVLAKLNRSGLHVDTGGNPATFNKLINTPQLLAKEQETWDYTPSSPANSLRTTISIDQNDSSLFKDYQDQMRSYLSNGRKQYATVLLKVRLSEYEKIWKCPSQKQVHLKLHYKELLNHLLSDFSLYFEIEEANNLDIVDKLVEKQVFTEESGHLLKEAVAAVHLARVDLHLSKGEQTEDYSMQTENPTQQALEKAYWLVLRPLYRTLKDALYDKKLLLEDYFHKYDLVSQAFGEEMPNPESVEELVPLVKHLVRHHAKDQSLLSFKDFLELHENYYKRLSTLTFAEPLREAYLKTLELYSEEKEGTAEVIRHLASISNRNGYMQAHRIEEEQLEKAIIGMASEKPGKIKISCPALPDGAFLKEEVARQIFDEQGNIKTQYDCAHSVAKATYIDDQGVEYTLHFKQKPVHPLMEYGVHSLTGRIAGSLTPATQLARFEVDGRMYPVLISRTVFGTTLKDIEDTSGLDAKQLTWACLSAIMTRPGDGRLSNYVVEKDTGRIFCVDNDISFVEPLTTYFLRKTIHFSSALFCLDPIPLETSVLEAFVALSPDFILQGWIEDLIEKDGSYRKLHLFTKEEEEQLYGEDKENRFKSTLLLRSGTAANLLVQFHHLQDFVRFALREKKPLYPVDLLKTLVTLRERQKQPLGNYIHASYAQALARIPSIEKRLGKAVKRNVGVSMTSSQSDGVSFGKFPSFEEILNREEFSPEKAKEELMDFTLSQCTSDIDLYHSKGKAAVHANFHRIVKEGAPDKERQEIVLSALIYWIESKGIKNIEVAITNCEVLETAILKPLLHEGLESLNLSGCPLINEEDIQEIEKQCPQLKKLYLNGCSKLGSFEKITRTFIPDYLSFPKLEELQLSGCKNLSLVCVDAPVLREIKLDKNPLLKILLFKQIALYSCCSVNSCSQLYFNRTKKAGIDKLLGLKESKPLPTGLRYQQVVQLYMDDPALKQIKFIFERNKGLFSSYNYKWNQKMQVFADAFRNNKTLLWLNLNSNLLMEDGIKVFADALRCNDTLQILELDNNLMGSKGAKALADGIKHNSSLTYLSLNSNDIRDEGAEALAEAIANHSSLKHLRVNRNNIGSRGARAFAQALLTNKSLETLNLNSTFYEYMKIGDKGAAALAHAVALNQTLKELHLFGQKITDIGAKEFVHTFKFNPSFNVLYLSYKGISREMEKKLAAAAGQSDRDNDSVLPKAKNKGKKRIQINA